MTRCALLGALAAASMLESCHRQHPDDVVITHVVVAEPAQQPAQLYVSVNHRKRRLPLVHTMRFGTRGHDSVRVEFSTDEGWSVVKNMTRGRHLVLILPAVWTVPEGRFAGSVVRTDAVISQVHSVASLLKQDFRLWRHLPVPVTFDSSDMVAGPSEQRLPSHESTVRFAINQINDAVGFVVLRPAVEDTPILAKHKGIHVTTIDGPPSILGRAIVTERGCIDHAARGRQAVWCYPRWIHASRVNLHPRAEVPDAEHELLHALGLDHTCIIPSVMATEFTSEALSACGRVRHQLGLQAPLVLRRELSAYDVVAVRMLHRIATDVGLWQGNAVHWLPVNRESHDHEW